MHREGWLFRILSSGYVPFHDEVHPSHGRHQTFCTFAVQYQTQNSGQATDEEFQGTFGQGIFGQQMLPIGKQGVSLPRLDGSPEVYAEQSIYFPSKGPSLDLVDLVSTLDVCLLVQTRATFHSYNSLY